MTSRTASAAICVACFLQTALQTILVRYASTSHVVYSQSFTVWMTELVKLLVAGAVWAWQGAPRIHWRVGWVVPALCYAVNNRLFFYTLQFVDGGTFQILSNLKIMTTLLWSVALLRKPFSRNQWAACALLTVGAMLVQGQSVGVDGWLPLLLIGVTVTSSGFASVWTERLLRDPVEEETFPQQCVQLYALGLPLIGIYMVWDPPGAAAVYTTPLWVAILVNGSLQGLVIGTIMKFLGSIPRLIATVSSVGLTVLYTSLHESEAAAHVLSATFLTGNALVVVAVVLYNAHALCPPKTKSEVLPM